ncbi:LacI family transcriptional regulator [Microbacterium nanhaiense]|uniref:LacI family transcriptional regulator n=1 Tax=Microbacterium nanhaiense TaxID=1301026 RepID=A0ABQ2N2V8_9MICO|nr:LacI family DNA-binding transcriptional regulator [Microbacterium nanhaiense]GGO64894.1 LacI family transcriptional regulator [Microbacterium nanhaiense]
MATMRDVAERAGVSIATVSFVVNGTKRVTDATRARVEDAMRELGFRRNPVGAALANGRTRIIALLFPTLERTLSHTAVAFFTSAARRARERGYDLILWPIGSDIEHIDVLARGGLVDGVILMEVKLDDPRVAALAVNHVPFAMIGRTADPSGVPYVDIDMATSAREAYERLAALGHRDIAYVYSEGVQYDHGADARSRQAYREAAAAHGRPATLIPCAEHPTAGRELGERFAAEHPDATAVILLNEHAAPGLLAGLAQAGVRVPQDLSVLSLGSSAYMASMTDPPLSYLRTPGPELGELGFDAVLQRLTAPDEAPMQALLPCEYVPGDTMAAPRG